MYMYISIGRLTSIFREKKNVFPPTNSINFKISKNILQKTKLVIFPSVLLLIFFVVSQHIAFKSKLNIDLFTISSLRIFPYVLVKGLYERILYIHIYIYIYFNFLFSSFISNI